MNVIYHKQVVEYLNELVDILYDRITLVLLIRHMTTLIGYLIELKLI